MSKNVEINEEVIVADMNAILKIFFQTSMDKKSDLSTRFYRIRSEFYSLRFHYSTE